MSGEVTTQYVREAPEIEAFKYALMQGAKGFAENNNLAQRLREANQITGNFITGATALPQLTAGLSGLQQQAIAGVADYGQVGTNAQGQPVFGYIPKEGGIGGYQPYFDQASGYLTSGQGLLGGAAGATAQISPETAYQQGNQALQQGLTEAGQLQQYQTAAGSGLGTVAQGTQGVGAAADQAGQFLQADLGRSQALMGQGAQAAREATSDFSRARNVLGGGLGTATQVAQAGLPGQQQAQSTLEMGLGTLTGATEGYNPNRAAQFMNPYQQEVTQQALKEMRRQASMAENQAAAQAVRAGAFGGTREGVQRAEQERNVQDLMSQRIFQDYAQNYGQAQQAAMQAFEQQQGRELGAGQAMSQVGGLQSQVGSQTANLLAQQAALQSQFGQQFGALEGQETALDLQRAQQLAAIGQQFGQQGVQQAQLGQQGTQLQGQLSAQEAQLGLLPANIASQQANIGSQEAQLYNQLGLGLGSLAQNQTAQELQQQQLLGQLGMQTGQLGMQNANLGQLSQSSALGDINAMTQLGQLQQSTRQAEIDAQRRSLYEQTMSPYQTYAFVGDMAKNAPSTQMALTQTSAPQASPLQQGIGLAGALISGTRALSPPPGAV